MKKIIFLLAVLFLLVPMASHAQTHQFCPTDATCTWTGPQTFTGNVSVGGTLGIHTVFADAQAGSDFGAKVNAAVALAVAGDTVDARGFNTNQTVSTIPAISKSVRLLLPGVTLTCNMADPGTASGCFNVTANGVTIEGVPGLTTITQTAGKNIQTLMYFGSSQKSTVTGVIFNTQETTLTRPGGQFYTCVRSLGGSNLTITRNEFTACGDRGIDVRENLHTWITNNYLHQTGINVLGSGGTGNATSVDVNTTGVSADTWFIGNTVEEWGDTAIACPHGSRCHVIGNTVRGRRDFGNAPSSIEMGIDFVGCSDCEATGNHIINVENFPLDSEVQVVSGITYTPFNIRITGNEFTHNLGSTFNPRVFAGSVLGTGQLKTFTITGNVFNGVLLQLQDIDGLTVTGNAFQDIGTQFWNNSIRIDQANAVMKNFVIEGNSFQTTNASVTTAIQIAVGVTTPGNSYVGPNAVSTAITTAFNNLGTAIPVVTVNGSGNSFQFVNINASGQIVTTGNSIISTNGLICASNGGCNAGASGTPFFQVYTDNISMNSTGRLLVSGSAPTIAAGGCGGAAASIANNNGAASFTVNVGTTPTTACTITMPSATNGWNCLASDITTNSTTVFLQKQTATGTTSVTITNFNDVAVAANFTASDILQVSCFAR